MKRIIAICASVILLACGCSQLEDKTGYVGYIYYTLDSETLDEADFKVLDRIYTEQFEMIEDASVKDGYIYMYGKYGDLDKKVLEACSRAEKKIESLDGFKMEGKYLFTINAVYTMNVVADFYVKRY
ncbi:MAG: hypothetical protein MJY70_06135 [Bacteroidales bacterium]|nr:hypothetical protein [Bacteroidales bacterium]